MDNLNNITNILYSLLDNEKIYEYIRKCSGRMC